MGGGSSHTGRSALQGIAQAFGATYTPNPVDDAGKPTTPVAVEPPGGSRAHNDALSLTKDPDFILQHSLLKVIVVFFVWYTVLHFDVHC